MKLFKVA